MWVLQKPLSGDAVEVQLTDTGTWTWVVVVGMAKVGRFEFCFLVE